jgi:hypothetical protein
MDMTSANRRRFAGLTALALATLAGAPASAPAAAERFEVRANPFVVGQAPDWLGRRHVVYHDPLGRDEGGDGRSEVRVARFDPSGPRLVDEHVVRPGNGHWYETQWWAPDGSGFLYTETAGTAINPELFFCRLRDPAHGRCRPSRLTRHPAWDEQAVFTPRMDRVIFMSSRNLPGAYDTGRKWLASSTCRRATTIC